MKVVEIRSRGLARLPKVAWIELVLRLLSVERIELSARRYPLVADVRRAIVEGPGATALLPYPLPGT